jgi:hypothetical protein
MITPQPHEPEYLTDWRRGLLESQSTEIDTQAVSTFMESGFPKILDLGEKVGKFVVFKDAEGEHFHGGTYVEGELLAADPFPVDIYFFRRGILKKMWANLRGQTTQTQVKVEPSFNQERYAA